MPAGGGAAALLLGMPDDQGMELVEQGGIRRQAGFKQAAQGLVAFLPAAQFQCPEQTPRVGVDDEYRALEGVQQDVVRRLGSDALDPQQRLAQPGRGTALCQDTGPGGIYQINSEDQIIK